MTEAIIVTAGLAAVWLVVVVAGRFGLDRPIIEGQDYPATRFRALWTVVFAAVMVVVLPGWWKLAALLPPLVWLPWVVRYRP